MQRLSRHLSSDERKVIAQAIDATNEAAVRVMVRQVSKELGGLDGAVYCEAPIGEIPQELREPTVDPDRVLEWMSASTDKHLRSILSLTRHVGRELDRKGGGPIVLLGRARTMRVPPLPTWWPVEIDPQGLAIKEVAIRTVGALAAPPP